MFPKINPKQSFPALEKEILRFWKKNKIFERSIKIRSAKKRYVFYDGPPFATGLPHYGHIIASVIKDVIPRYKTMQGFRVERRWGWDCHGLPIENLIEKEQKIKNKKEIEADIAKFNQACKKSVLRYRDYWQKFIPRIGRWVDMQNDYCTMDAKYMESIWWVFKNLYDKGLIYQDYKPMHLCPRCETTLSNFEVTLGYQEVEDLSVFVKFKIKDNLQLKNLIQDLKNIKVHFLAWTTTPWTLPGNTALAVNPELDYLIIAVPDKSVDEYYILAEDRLKFIFPDEKYEVLAEIKGHDLTGLFYEPLFDFYQDYQDQKEWQNAYKTYSAKFVNLEGGTGIVHIAPAFGEDDYELAKKHNLPAPQNVKTDGTFTAEINLWSGEQVKPAHNPRAMDKKIAHWLKDNNKLLDQKIIRHSYPHCWRCDAPLLNYSANSWFVNVQAIKQQLIQNNQKISWMPQSLKDGRFGKWLENARDWAISRSRYWGTPLPVWQCEKCKKIKVIGSVQELQSQSLNHKKILDLHRPFIDQIKLKCECGKTMKRVKEVFDCWFESGSMPYAEKHYLGKALKDFNPEKGIGFPADFIAEGVDQTRGWFYTLHVLATALFNQPAYKNVVVNGIILAEDGKKMSKRLKNYPDPKELIDKYGSDALRLYLMSSPAVKGQSLRFAEKDLENLMRRVILHFWNTISFFTTYANIDQWKPNNKSLDKNLCLLDKWIFSRLNSLILKEKKFLEKFDLIKAVKEFEKFVDELSNWYIRRSRRRFWKSENDQDKDSAYETLFTVLLTLSKLMAPFMPFLSEYAYQILTKNQAKILNSVHLCKYPKMNKKLIDTALNKKMDLVLKIVKLAHQARNKANLSLRQPLEKLQILSKKLNQQLADLILDEANVQELEFFNKVNTEIIEKNVKLNLEKIGKKYGAKTKDILNLLKNKQYKIEKKTLRIGEFVLTQDEFVLEYKSKNPTWRVAFEGDLMILLKTKVTSDLREEFEKRELVRKIQEERKKMGFKVESRIRIYACLNEKWEKLLDDEYVKKEILCQKILKAEENNSQNNQLVLEKDNWIRLEEVVGNNNYCSL